MNIEKHLHEFECRKVHEIKSVLDLPVNFVKYVSKVY